MARPFGKRVTDWRNLPSTKSLLISFKNTRFSGIIETKRGRNVGGTWIHRKLAIAFALWLSDDFHLWEIEDIYELTTYE